MAIHGDGLIAVANKLAGLDTKLRDLKEGFLLGDAALFCGRGRVGPIGLDMIKDIGFAILTATDGCRARVLSL